MDFFIIIIIGSSCVFLCVCGVFCFCLFVVFVLFLCVFCCLFVCVRWGFVVDVVVLFVCLLLFCSGRTLFWA